MKNPAASVRREKEQHPERFCPVCLWRVKHTGGPDTPCRKHPQPLPTVPMFTPEQCDDCGMPFNDAERSKSGKCTGCEA